MRFDHSFCAVKVLKFEARNFKSEMVRPAHPPEQSRRAISKFEFSNYLKKLDLCHLEFGFVSSFDIRISDFDLLSGDAKTFVRLCKEILGHNTSYNIDRLTCNLYEYPSHRIRLSSLVGAEKAKYIEILARGGKIAP
jgi:hypothetical protein